ncbi:MAG: LytTR family transcriptional regulator DNA-binding domain-containing protein [Cyclobacteriaceae bacterium]
MKIKVLIIEDNPITSQDLSEIISDHGMIVTSCAKNKLEARTSIENNEPDILLVDINLKGGDDGIDFVEEVTTKLKIPVVYLTANSDKSTMDRAFKTKPASFLTKPYDDKDVIIAIELAFSNHCNDVLVSEVATAPFIFLKCGKKFDKVPIENINYLQAEGSYSKFVTTEKEYFLSGNLNNISNKLKNPSFLRIHRSYVVNVENITGLDSDYVFIGETNIPISRSYKEDVNRILRKIS